MIKPPQYIYENIKVLRVVDGDTVDFEFDLGFKTWRRERCRLYGINAWEKRGKEKEKGIKAMLWLDKRMDEAQIYPYLHMTSASKKSALKLKKPKITIQTFKQGKYGRYLVIIWVDGKNINKELVKKGHAEINYYK